MKSRDNSIGDQVSHAIPPQVVVGARAILLRRCCPVGKV
jgi:hypothetical protein